MSNVKYAWIDLEMTGLPNSHHLDQRGNVWLGCQHHTILELACILTDENLNPIDEISFALKADDADFDKQDSWCWKTHGESGLIDLCRASDITLEQAENAVLDLFEKHGIKPRQVHMAGNSIHADYAFISAQMPRLTEQLHYRLLDVSSYKLLFADKAGVARKVQEIKSEKHEALADIKESIEEMRLYMKLINVTNKPVFNDSLARVP